MVDKDFSDAKRDNWTSLPLKGQITAYDSEKGDKAKIMLMKMIFFCPLFTIYNDKLFTRARI